MYQTLIPITCYLAEYFYISTDSFSGSGFVSGSADATTGNLYFGTTANPTSYLLIFTSMQYSKPDLHALKTEVVHSIKWLQVFVYSCCIGMVSVIDG